MSPIHVSHARQSIGPPSQSTGPPMNRIISQTFLVQFGLMIIQISSQTPYCDIVDTDMVNMDMADMDMVDIMVVLKNAIFEFWI